LQRVIVLKILSRCIRRLLANNGRQILAVISTTGFGLANGPSIRSLRGENFLSMW